MPKFACTVIVSAPEGETQEWNPVIDAATYVEAMLRAYVQSVEEFTQFRKKNKLSKLVVQDATIHIKELKNEDN